MFMEMLFTKVKKWKQPKCPLMNEWINKMWYIHKEEPHIFLERNKDSINLGDIVPSEIG